MQKKNEKKKAVSLKNKRYVIVGFIGVCVILCTITLIIFSANNKTTSIETASMQTNEPKAITVKGRTPNANNFHYEESLETGSNGEKIKVPVPNGYVGSCAADESYVNGVTTNGVREHHGGFVIYEKNAGETDEDARTAIQADIATAQKTRNQWVWVPIASAEVSNMYHTSGGVLYGNRYIFTASGYTKKTSYSNEPNVSNYDNFDHTYLKQYLEGISRAEFLQEMREEFHEMLESVKSYGGFYIGRYETGNINRNKAIVVKGNSNIGNVVWYKMYLRCRGLRGTVPVHTGLIWGIQWDEVLKWIIDSGEKTYAEVGSDSTSWGNYNNSNVSGHGNKQPTGYSEVWKANNIYDIAGNVFEWTMENTGSYCPVRRWDA